MDHFYQDIHGWFSYEGLYRDAVGRAQDGALFVEIGSFKGKSSAFMAVEIANCGKQIKFDCIDPMKPMSHYLDAVAGTPDEWADYGAGFFHQRMLPVKDYYRLLEMTSAEAAAQYEDASIDFIMIDGDHTYQGVRDDVKNFLPKMKSGGIMVGDDAWAAPVMQAAKDAVAEYNPNLTVTLPTGLHFFIQIP